MLAGSISPELHREIESAAYMAAQRIELCERKLWVGKGDKSKEPILKIDNIVGDSVPMQTLKQSIKVGSRIQCNNAHNWRIRDWKGTCSACRP